MIVIDASVLANVLGDDGEAGERARGWVAEAGELAAPDLVDVESAAVLRRRWLARTMSAARLRSSFEDLATMPIQRFPASGFLRRVYELRANVTPYDALYVALAEELGCPLVTADAALAGASGPRCEIQVLA